MSPLLLGSDQAASRRRSRSVEVGRGQQGSGGLARHGLSVDGLTLMLGPPGAGLIEGSAVPPLENARSSPIASPAISSAVLTAVTSRECLWDGRTGWGATVVTAASSGAFGRRLCRLV
jgi:hypothetical protein